MSTPTPQTIRRQIADIDATLQSGARSITLDGVTITLDPATLQKERERLELLLPERKRRRPFAYRVQL